MVHQVLLHFGFRYSSPQSTPLPTGNLLSAPPSVKSVEPSGPYPELVGCLMITYLLTNLGEQPRSSLVLYIDNKAMIALCQEHRLEHRTMLIALRYFLAPDLQQLGQLRLAYVATWANSADIFTKALQPGSAQAGPSSSGGVGGAGEAGGGVAGGYAPIASVSSPAKDDMKAFNPEKFSGEDRASWSVKMELLFSHNGLLEVIDGELKRPASEGATKEWDRRSKDGFFLLSQCLSSNQLHHVKHLIKDILCRAFNQLWDLYVKLSSAGADYPEKIKCYKALSLLPESWGPLVVNLNGMKDSWSLEWICAQVLQEEIRRKELTATFGEGGGSAYGMKGFKGRGSKKGKAKEGSGGEQYSGGKRGNKGGKRCGGKCWYCHVEGHPWLKCRKLPDGWRPGHPSVEDSKSVHGAMGEGMCSEEGDGGAGGHGGMFYHMGEACSEDMVVPASKVDLHRSSHWVIDTGAFMTMTNREDLLDEVRPLKAATIISATGQVVPVRGQWRAMFMGADGRIMGLKRVLLVPGLCANILSTKALSEVGMKMEMMGTKVFKEILDGRVLWDLRGSKDMQRSMWEIPVPPWKEAAVHLATEAVRGGHATLQFAFGLLSVCVHECVHGIV
ncbi:unnamed protein product [Closterium sp. NIES-54]